ncbi:metal-dependent hydrolase family protein [Salinispora arenicola]|uniref:metal-dependent hydrolase family protein n=1 Tax=Salinispora arenicola TaxID=168697 RepID=UPI00036130B2|nr:amidohydrolase family protein [Salinispora arenicola]
MRPVRRPDPSAVFAVRAARMFDGFELHTGHPLVFVKKSRIVGIDRSGAHPATEVPVVDLGDATLLPGLIDTHVHLAFDPEVSAKQEIVTDSDATIVRRMRRHAGQHLMAGVTTVRDLGDRGYLSLDVRDSAGQAPGLYPEILCAGPPITRHGGHCWFLGGEADGADAIRKAVAHRVARGVDAVKIMATGGAITPGWRPDESQYNAEELRCAAETAHRSGVPITAHAHGPQGIADAVAGGADGVEHCSFFTRDGIEPDWELVDAMAEVGTYVGATEAWLPEGKMLAPHLAQRLEQRTQTFARMHRVGVRLVCCSDAGAGPRKPHGVLPHGIVHLGANGWANVEALRSVTTLAAEACALADRKGRIAVGHDADLLAVAGNPLERLTDMFRVSAVWRGGTPVDLRTVGSRERRTGPGGSTVEGLGRS